MAAPYAFWLRGTDSFVTTDANSECTTTPADNFPTSIAEPSVVNGWIEVAAYAADPHDKDEGEAYTTPSGAQYDDPLMREFFILDLERYAFPGDWTAYNALRTHLRKPYLHLAVKTYDVTIHGASKCVAVTRTFEVEHDHQGGKKRVTLTLARRKPHA